ncbi:carbohydrate kinase [Nitratireductor sp. StC3]|uniref:carbohydrate kinase family protein n=1 Tax=Nitratireductor sp. StC3 TaxID=2126741 RepID=UPI000D0E1C0D|nr:carbohydrate kinase [Nitratireductor sp. StC3]PSM18276.1 carbohydrate kinase [Nitratireductor sp. StC3]
MILCCGEALIDMLPRPVDAGAVAYVPQAGGAVFNTAVALGRLGVATGFFAGLSTDPFGALLDGALRASRVDTRHVRRSGRPTTLAFVTLGDGQAQYLFYDENTAGRMLELQDLPVLDDAVEALHFGAISLVSEPCGSTYEALMARERTRRVIVLDPNIRPDFIADPQRHRARLRRMMAMSDIVKLSDEDLAWLTGSDSDDAARGLLDLGPGLVVVTRGAAGASGHVRDRTVTVPAPPVSVADTLGAGDTFNAGLLAFLSQNGLLSKAALCGLGHEALVGALGLAARAAAVTVSRTGANPPWRAEIG